MAADYEYECSAWTEYAVPTLYATVVVSSAFYIRSYRREELRSSRLQFMLVVIFYGAVFINLTVNMLFYMDWCRSSWGAQFPLIILILTGYFYPLMSVMLVAVLFVRLVAIFKNTEYQVSKRAIRNNAIYLVINLSIFLVGMSTMFACYTEPMCIVIGLPLLGLSGILYFGQIFLINFLFIRRLARIYKLAKESAVNDANKTRFVNTITRTAWLTFVSTTFSVGYSILFPMLSLVGQSTFFSVFHDLVFIGDILTNFVCVYWSHALYHRWYMKFCGVCHAMCFHCCCSKELSSIGKENDVDFLTKEVQMQQIEANEASSAASVGAETSNSPREASAI